ncbi:hypothetical protein GTS_02020 [Gandjariella thermophila]|uniref:Uncharacterized protein n=1 Tax=Gandjariella thermophila TaxID=1931992 RepID=A0A4D4J1R0_9PSEU|nr:hypothetical protein GTS_02020 [Gandjariella thermophila]
MLAQGRGTAQPGAPGDLVDRQVGGFQQVPGVGEPLLDQPGAGGEPGLRSDPPAEGPHAREDFFIFSIISV